MATKKINKMTIAEQAEHVLKNAQDKGVDTNFFFVTTFKRYQVQMKILTELEDVINNEGSMVTKEYVKGRANLYVNPAITEYNRTATSANQTVITLIKIVDGFAGDDNSNKQSKLDKLIKEAKKA